MEGLTLPDPDDRHVLAAAIHCKAQVIVTCDLKDFPKKNLKAFNIEAQHPDDFLQYNIDLSPNRFLKAVKDIRSRLKNPPLTAQQYLEKLRNPHNLLQTVAFLEQNLKEL